VAPTTKDIELCWSCVENAGKKLAVQVLFNTGYSISTALMYFLIHIGLSRLYACCFL